MSRSPEEAHPPTDPPSSYGALLQPAAPTADSRGRRGSGDGGRRGPRRTLHPAAHVVPPQGGTRALLLPDQQEAAEGADGAASERAR